MGENICKAELKLPGPRSLAEAIQVDNMEAPGWLKAECVWSQGFISCRIEVEGCNDPKRIMSLRNTIFDIILCYRAAADAVKAVGPGGGR